MGDRKLTASNAIERREVVSQLVATAMREQKLDYDSAYALVQREQPALFSAMQQPAERK
jgi:hypothetical protein